MDNNKYEIQNKIFNLQDINISSKILLYFLICKFKRNKDNNISLHYGEINAVIGFDIPTLTEVSEKLKFKGYIKIDYRDPNILTLSTKTLTVINMMKVAKNQ